MTSSLFDPAIERAIRIAKKGKKAKVKVAPPPRLVPLLSFKTMPDKAKETVLEVLDTDDDFRERVAEGVTEAKHGRFTFSYLTRPEGWETFISNMVEADGPVVQGSSGSVAELEDRLEKATAARLAAEQDAKRAREALTAIEGELDQASDDGEVLRARIDELTQEVEKLKEQRQRAVGELKTTESVMARHIAARKQLETTVEQMASAQLSSTTVGGSITDAEVRVGLDAIDFTVAELRGQLDSLRRASTPERVQVARRVPLVPPLGLVDDSVEFAEYVLKIPNVVVLIDGYNVTKEAKPNLELADQRSWLERRLTDYAALLDGRFEIIFDGADVSAEQSRGSSVRVRFSPDGVEADDVIIAAVKGTDPRRPVVAISSDKRVREGALASGANVLHSRQLIAVL